jgi:hypothetical protein
MRGCMRVLGGGNQCPRRHSPMTVGLPPTGIRLPINYLAIDCPSAYDRRYWSTHKSYPTLRNSWCTSGAPMVHVRLPGVFAVPVEGSDRLFAKLRAY